MRNPSRSAVLRRELEVGEPKREQPVDDDRRPPKRIDVAAHLTLQGNEEADDISNQARQHDRSATQWIDDIARKP